MNAGDTVLWIGGAPCRPRKVQLVEECGDGFIYQTLGGRDGWQARAPRSDFAPIPLWTLTLHYADGTSEETSHKTRAAAAEAAKFYRTMCEMDHPRRVIRTKITR